MAAFDVWVQTVFFTFLPYLVVAFMFIKIWKRYGRRMYGFLVARLIIVTGESYSRKMRHHKIRLFAPLHDLTAALLPEKPTVVEIGSGGGANFCFYPDNIKLKCVDPNPSFKTFLSEKGKEFDQIDFEYCPGVAEDLSEIGESSVDAVVCTLVLCSVDDVKACLAEIKRILKPEGKFFFMEHVAAETGTWTNFFQKFLKIPWGIFFDCHLGRKPWLDIEKAGFSSVEIEHVWVEYPWHYRLFAPQIIGTATN